MRLAIILIIFVHSSFSFGQVDAVSPKMLEFKYDSCDVSVWDIHFKDASDSWNDSIYPSRRLAQTGISKYYSEELLKALMNSNSYDDTRANLTHYDIVITFYLSGKEVTEVEISAMTGNIDIYNRSNEYYFRNNCSEPFGKYLVDLLNEYGIIELVGYDEINIEGLN